MDYTEREKDLLTVDSDILVEVEVFDGVAKSLDVQLAREVPDKGLGIEHVGGELCECSSVSDLETALEVQSTMSTAVLGDEEENRNKVSGESKLIATGEEKGETINERLQQRARKKRNNGQ